MELKPGTRLRSAVDDTEVVVVSSPTTDVDLRCGGQPMVPPTTDVERGAPAAAHTAGTQLGKRYADPTSGLEVLCTKAGQASLSLGEDPLGIKDSKALPSSD